MSEIGQKQTVAGTAQQARGCALQSTRSGDRAQQGIELLAAVPTLGAADAVIDVLGGSSLGRLPANPVAQRSPKNPKTATTMTITPTI
jgi:hypothetical protein